MKFDFSECKNVTAATKLARKETVERVKEMLIADCGAEDVSQISTTEIAFQIGDYTDSDGFIHDVTAVAKIVIKSIVDSKEGVGRPREAFDRLEAARLFEIEQKYKEKPENK